ncbi:MAG: type II secretion system protein GspK [Luteimonas sp.]
MPSQRGFVLVAVLAVLVMLSILGAAVATITQRLGDEQIERDRQLRAEVAMASTRATVMYLLTSQRMTFGGLTVDDRVVLSEDERRIQQQGDETLSFMPVGNEVALDASVHHGLDGTRFALQDDRGLLAINWAPAALLESYLGGVDAGGATTTQPFGTLLNLLADYQDPDDLYRLNSAEKARYARENRPPPSNRTLVTPMELRRVIGWDEALTDIDDADLVDSLTVVRSAQINVNTAPARVLRTLPGIDAATADRVVAARSASPFISLVGFYQLLNAVPADEELLSLYPVGSGTLKLWSPEGGAVQVLHWTLTPRDEGGRPWREDYEFILPGNDTANQASARTVAAKVFAQPDAAPQ